MSKLSDAEREIVKTLLDSHAVNFEAIGSTFAKYGPSAVLNLDYEDFFCGTNRLFIHIYRFPPGPWGPWGPQEGLGPMRAEIAGELRR